MLSRSLRPVLLLALLSFVPGAAAAAEEASPSPPADPARSAEAAKAPEMLVETRHTATAEGKPLAYRALAGELQISDAKGKPTARMFYIAYLKDLKGAEEVGGRPLTFVWNGGPGSSAVWLHLGAFGPKRVETDKDGNPTPPPYRLVPNEHTLLDVTDLVFVDPISTGYSRPVPGEEAQQFHSVQGDVESVGELIRLFVTRHGRWGSPVFLLGESYGTIRAAGLADYLQRRFNLYPNGVILISPALDMQTFLNNDGNDLPYVLVLPSLTATAWYHKKLPADLQGDLQKAVREAEEFAYGDYDDALLRGSSLPAPQRKEVAARLARLTGLSEEEVERQNLRIDRFVYGGKLLEKERRQIGVLDSRYWGYPNEMPIESFAPVYAYLLTDPSTARVFGLFAGAFNQYLREDLGVKSEAYYETLSLATNVAWDYQGVQNRYLYTAGNLRAAMTLNTDLKVFVASGTYDLVTTPFAARYILDHLDIHPELRKNLTVSEYEAGHMMYLHEPSRARLKRDLAAFYAAATGKR